MCKKYRKEELNLCNSSADDFKDTERTRDKGKDETGENKYSRLDRKLL
jgi:hypothetical protein